MFFSVLVATLNVALVVKFWTFSPNIHVSESGVEKLEARMRAMGWSTALLFLTPAMISCLTDLSERSVARLEPMDDWENMLSLLDLLISLTQVYLFWRVLFICTDDYNVSENSRGMIGDSANTKTEGPEPWDITKLIICLSYGPVVIVGRFLLQWLSPPSMEEALLTSLRVDLLLRVVMAIGVIYYSWKIVGILAKVSRLPGPREKLLLVLWLYPIIGLIRQALFLSLLTRQEPEEVEEIGSEDSTEPVESLSEVLYESDNAMIETVTQVQLLIISLLHWRAWSTEHVRAVFERRVLTGQTPGYLSDGEESAKWEDVPEEETAGNNLFEQPLLDDYVPEVAYENLLDF